MRRYAYVLQGPGAAICSLWELRMDSGGRGCSESAVSQDVRAIT